jgi:DeoR family deoxyribose operon repressor
LSKKQDRKDSIENILQKENSMPIQKLADLLQVSNMTIRRALQELEKEHSIHLYNGIAVINKERNLSVVKYLNDINSESIEKINTKIEIGKIAANYIKKDDVVLFDNGSTIDQIIRQLPPEMSLTVITYNINAIVKLYQNPNYKMIVTGGYLHRNTGMLQSEEAIALISRTGINKAFISASGISSLNDVTTVAEYEVDIKKACINTAVEKILVIDSQKFDKVCVAKFATLKDFDTIITDNQIPDDVKNKILEMNIKLLLTK